jgi:hypothetical protein
VAVLVVDQMLVVAVLVLEVFATKHPVALRAAFLTL